MAEAKTTTTAKASSADKATTGAKKGAEKAAEKPTAKPAAKSATKAKATKADTTATTAAKGAKKATEKVAEKATTAAKKDTAKPAAKPTAKAKADSTPTPAKTKLLRLHHLRPAPGSRPAKTRVGRGEASKGKTAGRGTKGTKARYQVKVGFEGGQMPLHMRLPKLRGFRNPFKVEFQVVNLDRLVKVFPKGGKVGIEELILNGLVRNGHPVKVLAGTAEINVKFDITADAFSKSAIAKLEANGGSATVTSSPAEKPEKPAKQDK
jgi:large subunit ribosomal protein L15